MKTRQQLFLKQSLLTLCSLLAATIVLLGCSPDVSAQWSTSGTNVYYNGGNVGIGTASPDTNAELHVYKAAGAGVDIQSADAGGWARFRLVTGIHTYGWFTGDSTQADAPNKIGLYDYTAGAFRIMVDSDGKIAFGTTSPGDLLEINKSQNSGTTLTLDNPYTSAGNAAYSGSWFKQNGSARFFFGSVNDNNTTQAGGAGATQLWNFVDGPMLFSTNNTERVRITSSGNVGIGTTSPNQFGTGSTLHLHTAAADPNGSSVIHFTNMTTGSGPTNGFVIGRFSYSGFNNPIVWNYENTPLLFATNNTERLRIDASGSVGIGTATPTSGYKLDINGNTNVTGNLNTTGTITGGNIQAKYQDVAEWVPSPEQVTAGTVVVLDTTKSNQVISSTVSYDTRVAGVVSERTGLELGENGAGKVLVATTGRVMVKVDASRAPIHIGDLLVTSDKPGIAMKSEPVSLGGVQLHPGHVDWQSARTAGKGFGKNSVLLSLQ